MARLAGYPLLLVAALLVSRFSEGFSKGKPRRPQLQRSAVAETGVAERRALRRKLERRRADHRAMVGGDSAPDHIRMPLSVVETARHDLAAELERLESDFVAEPDAEFVALAHAEQEAAEREAERKAAAHHRSRFAAELDRLRSHHVADPASEFVAVAHAKLGAAKHEAEHHHKAKAVRHEKSKFVAELARLRSEYAGKLDEAEYVADAESEWVAAAHAHAAVAAKRKALSARAERLRQAVAEHEKAEFAAELARRQSEYVAEPESEFVAEAHAHTPRTAAEPDRKHAAGGCRHWAAEARKLQKRAEVSFYVADEVESFKARAKAAFFGTAASALDLAAEAGLPLWALPAALGGASLLALALAASPSLPAPVPGVAPSSVPVAVQMKPAALEAAPLAALDELAAAASAVQDRSEEEPAPEPVVSQDEPKALAVTLEQAAPAASVVQDEPEALAAKAVTLEWAAQAASVVQDELEALAAKAVTPEQAAPAASVVQDEPEALAAKAVTPERAAPAASVVQDELEALAAKAASLERAAITPRNAFDWARQLASVSSDALNSVADGLPKAELAMEAQVPAVESGLNWASEVRPENLEQKAREALPIVGQAAAKGAEAVTRTGLQVGAVGLKAAADNLPAAGDAVRAAVESGMPIFQEGLHGAAELSRTLAVKAADLAEPGALPSDVPAVTRQVLAAVPAALDGAAAGLDAVADGAPAVKQALEYGAGKVLPVVEAALKSTAEVTADAASLEVAAPQADEVADTLRAFGVDPASLSAEAQGIVRGALAQASKTSPAVRGFQLLPPPSQAATEPPQTPGALHPLAGLPPQ